MLPNVPVLHHTWFFNAHAHAYLRNASKRAKSYEHNFFVFLHRLNDGTCAHDSAAPYPTPAVPCALRPSALRPTKRARPGAR